jgi:hypothetical protein
LRHIVDGKRIEFFEAMFVVRRQEFEGQPPHDWNEWPEIHYEAAQEAIKSQVLECGDDARIISVYTHVDLAIHMSGQPWQFYVEIEVHIPV